MRYLIIQLEAFLETSPQIILPLLPLLVNTVSKKNLNSVITKTERTK